MQGARVFVDTNVVFYSRDIADDPRVGASRRWMAAAAGRSALCLNLQVLNELTFVLFRKRKDLSAEAIYAAIDELFIFGAAPISVETVLDARLLLAATAYSWWDCLLLASAIELGCSHFLSEDLQDGQRIGPLTIVDPFRHHPSEILGVTGT